MADEAWTPIRMLFVPVDELRTKAICEFALRTPIDLDLLAIARERKPVRPVDRGELVT